MYAIRSYYAINLLIGNNATAVFAAAEQAKKLGYRALVLSTTVTGETRHVAAVHAALAREIVTSGNPLAAPACLIRITSYNVCYTKLLRKLLFSFYMDIL